MREADLHLGVQRHRAGLVRQDGLGGRRKNLALAAGALFLLGQVVRPQHDVACGTGDGLAVGRRQNVVGRQHQQPRFRLRRGRQRNMRGHLVAIKVRVVGGAHERVHLDRLALDQRRLKRLDAQPVQRGRAVEQHRMLLDHLFQHAPDLGPRPFHHTLGTLDVLGQVLVHQLLHHEGLEELQRHLLGQAALV